jgi:phosphatidylinositol-3-phosphatase
MTRPHAHGPIAHRRGPWLAALLVVVAGSALIGGCGSAPSDGSLPTGLPTLPSVPARPPSGSPGPSTTAAPGGAAPHIMVIVEENREYGSVIGDPSAPYLNSLAASNGLATQWYAVSHPSLPNYLALVSGSTQEVHDDGAGHTFPGPTLVDQLAARGIGWRAYMEGMPSPCDPAPVSDDYAKKHDPFMYFSSITRNRSQCANVVPLGRLATDLSSGTAPPFLWVTPNLCHDGHDCGTATADAWLHAEMQTVTASSWYRQGASVIVTWDEGDTDRGCCTGAAGGQIPTLVVSSRGRQRLTTPGDHDGTLRGIEEAYGVGLLGAAADPRSGDLRPLLGP